MNKLEFKHDKKLAQEIIVLADANKAKILEGFFKTAPGEYGAGDKFLGITMPAIRLLAKKYQGASDELLLELLVNIYHEVRMLGALIMVARYEQAKTERDKKQALAFYLQQRTTLNNWDLVDVTVTKVWGNYLLDHPEARKQLYDFARSSNLWERRLAVVATMPLIKAGEFKDIIALSKLLIKDKEDLIQKALGWMLREVGKKDILVLKNFLNKYAARLARTTLRYALEKFSEGERKKYLQIKKS